MTRTILPRNEVREDFYRTPAWATWSIVRVVAGLLRRMPAGKRVAIVDPFCGDGGILDVLTAAFGPWAGTALTFAGIEINPKRHADAKRAHARLRRQHVFEHAPPAIFVRGDATKEATWRRIRDAADEVIVVTNPPYSISEGAIRAAGDRCLRLLCLMPLSFLGSEERDSFYLDLGTPSLHVLPKRPTFCVTRTCLSCKNVERVDPRDKQARRAPCASCGRNTLRVSTSDAQTYAWFQFGLDQESRVRRVPVHEQGELLVQQFEDFPCDSYARDLRITYGAHR